MLSLDVYKRYAKKLSKNERGVTIGFGSFLFNKHAKFNKTN